MAILLVFLTPLAPPYLAELFEASILVFSRSFGLLFPLLLLLANIVTTFLDFRLLPVGRKSSRPEVRPEEAEDRFRPVGRSGPVRFRMIREKRGGRWPQVVELDTSIGCSAVVRFSLQEGPVLDHGERLQPLMTRRIPTRHWCCRAEGNNFQQLSMSSMVQKLLGGPATSSEAPGAAALGGQPHPARLEDQPLAPCAGTRWPWWVCCVGESLIPLSVVRVKECAEVITTQTAERIFRSAAWLSSPMSLVGALARWVLPHLGFDACDATSAPSGKVEDVDRCVRTCRSDDVGPHQPGVRCRWSNRNVLLDRQTVGAILPS